MVSTLEGLLEVRGPSIPGDDEILTQGALAFLGNLVNRFDHRIDELLKSRKVRQEEYDRGLYPGPLDEPWAKRVRESEWTAAKIPEKLLKRRVEITGPVDRKMIINALNSGADVFMADFEDSNSPTWANCINGQLNLRDANEGKIMFDDLAKGKRYRLNDVTALLMVRPRGLHLKENHVLYAGKPISASLFDFALYAYHNIAESTIDPHGAMCFYIPKLESHLEARLWNDIINYTCSHLGYACDSIKVTLLIETLPAAFQMDEIIWELRDHIVGLNCGRWDYIFSHMKVFRARASRDGLAYPDRSLVTMETDFMSAYSRLLIRTCHRRGIFAMGGMAAQIPIKDDPIKHAKAMEKVCADKTREFVNGHDGTWVAHPALVSLALDAWDNTVGGLKNLVFDNTHQGDTHVKPEHLIPTMLDAVYTEKCLRHNIDVGMRYIDAWLRGSGCVPLYSLMEDAATAEISRMQVWQWIRAGVELDTGKKVTKDLVSKLIDQAYVNAAEDMDDAQRLFAELVLADDPADFLTLSAYDRLTQESSK